MKTKTNPLFKTSLLTIAAAVLISGCKKDDDDDFTPIEPQEGTISADMGSPLTNSVYVDLGTGSTTSVDINTWDLAFESNGEAILINTGKKANIINTESTDFAGVTSAADSLYSGSYVFEQTNGDLSMTAMGNWKSGGASKAEVYILNLGTDASGNPLGHKKLVVMDHTSGTSFQIKYADLDGSNEETKTINVSSDHNFTYFSLSSGNTVVGEPESGKWDIVLTPISVKTGPPFAPVYRLAASAQTNSYDNVGVVVDDPWSNLAQDDDPASDRNTKDINSSNYDALTKADYVSPSTDADAIGRSWMQILQPHSAGQYKIYDFMTFIVKDPDGKHFKLRFLSYTNPNTGENGTPQFEYKELQ